MHLLESQTKIRENKQHPYPMIVAKMFKTTYVSVKDEKCWLLSLNFARALNTK